MKNKILLVDDQQELRTLLAESFQTRGYEVLEASDGASLKAAFSGQQPDVALIDLKLPDARNTPFRQSTYLARRDAVDSRAPRGCP